MDWGMSTSATVSPERRSTFRLLRPYPSGQSIYEINRFIVEPKLNPIRNRKTKIIEAFFSPC
jgi:hypothetical protein